MTPHSATPHCPHPRTPGERARSPGRSTRALAAAVVLAALVLEACSGDSATPAPVTGTATSSTTPIAAAGAEGAGDPYFPNLGNGGYDVEQYTLDLEWDPDGSMLEASVAIRAEATQHLSSFNLDLIGFEVERVMVDGFRTSTERDGPELAVTPESPIAEGQDFEIGVTYRGTPGVVEDPSLPLDLGWVDLDEDGSYVFGEPNAASAWFPSSDHPSDKARFTFRVTVPDGLEVASNGLLRERIAGDGKTTWVWEMDDPMATYLAQVAISDFDIDEYRTASGLPIRDFFPAGSLEPGREAFAVTEEMLALYEELFGPYPFDVYGAVVVPSFVGAALETQTISIFGREIIASGEFGLDRTTVEQVIAHELAHQWFGNSVTPSRWQDIWLNEGFATYLELLWFEADRPGFDIDEAAERLRADLLAYMEEEPEVRPLGDPGPERLLDTPVYLRGGLTLHALRREVGDEDFFSILRTWAERYEHSNASTADLVALASEVAAQDLGGLFDTWLYSEDVPLLP